jgi:pyrroline-5-carboxylate reductase
MENLTIAFIGGGNIASSMIGGLIANGIKPEKLLAADSDKIQQQLISEKFGIRVFDVNCDAAKEADVIIFAVKPQVMRTVVKEIAENIKLENKLILSVAAGIKLQSIENWLGQSSAIIRIMPNTPALIQAGASALYANKFTHDKQRNTAETIMRSVGIAIWLDAEEQMNAVTALSGSGPAYFFYFMELIENNAIKMGLNKEDARLLTVETALGAAKMALLSSCDPETLRKQVSSPGGTTEQALNIFIQGKLNELVCNAMNAAKRRSIELSESFKD